MGFVMKIGVVGCSR